MIWATVSSPSYFWWLCRASPPLAAKNIIGLILAIWWCPCVVSSLVLLEEGVCYDQCILLAKLYEPLPCFILYSKAKFACYSMCFLETHLLLVIYGNLPASSNSKASAYNARDLGSIPGSGRSPGEGNGNPLQYSCLENPMDWGAW